MSRRCPFLYLFSTSSRHRSAGELGLSLPFATVLAPAADRADNNCHGKGL